MFSCSDAVHYKLLFFIVLYRLGYVNVFSIGYSQQTLLMWPLMLLTYFCLNVIDQKKFCYMVLIDLSFKIEAFFLEIRNTTICYRLV